MRVNMVQYYCRPSSRFLYRGCLVCTYAVLTVPRPPVTSPVDLKSDSKQWLLEFRTSIKNERVGQSQIKLHQNVATFFLRLGVVHNSFFEWFLYKLICPECKKEPVL